VHVSEGNNSTGRRNCFLLGAIHTYPSFGSYFRDDLKDEM